MTNLYEQRKKPFAQAGPLPSLPSPQSLLQFQLLMASTAANLVQADLFVTLGTSLKARLAARFGLRSSLHETFPFEIDTLRGSLTLQERRKRFYEASEP